MKIRNLDTFYWVASLGSFRAAAQKLNLTQPAITARIQVLEQDLGTEVFVRDTRNAELTPAGRKLLAYAGKLMELDQVIINAFSDTATIEQTIRLGASETIVSSWLADFLTHFAKSHPRLSFDLTVDSSNNMRNALVAREIDLAFLMGPIAEASIRNRNLCSYEMIFAATSAVAGRKIWTPEDLARQLIVTFSRDTRPHRLLRELLAPHAAGELQMTGSASLGAIVQLGVAGYGVCALPRAVVSTELGRGALNELRTSVKMSPISFTASFVSGTATSGLMAEISDEVITFLRPRLIKNIYQN